MSITTSTGNSEAGTSIPSSLLYIGVLVGLILTVFGVGLLSYGRGSLLSSLMTCVGFGIMLASFGSTAKGAWAGWTVTGAGATAIVLFLVLQYYQPAISQLYKKGQLRGDLSKIADLRIIDESPMYEYRDRTTSSIRFVLLEKKLKSDRLSIQVDTTEKGPGRESFELIGVTQTIQNRYLAEGIDMDRPIQWVFDYDKRVVKDGPDIIFSEQETLQEAQIPPQRTGLLRWPVGGGLLFTKAHAAEETVAPPNPVAINDLLAKLRSDDASERRNARDSLAATSPASIDKMMSAVHSDPSDYRLQGGVIYALSEMLRRNPNQRSAIAAALKNEDFPFLVAAASDDDKTVRLQAADFLYHLQDPRAVPPSVKAARSTPDMSKATNQVLIIRQSGLSLPTADKEKVINDLSAGPGSNNDLVGSQGLVRKTLGW
jgi:hypothetical protein